MVYMKLQYLFLTLFLLVSSGRQIHAQDPLNEGDDFGDVSELEEELGTRRKNTPPQPPPPTTNNTFSNDTGGKGNSAFGTNKKRTRPPINTANIEDITNENYPELIESFDFPNADISDVVKAISELTGKNFIIDSNAVHGKITIVAPTQITVAEAYKAFLSALAINNLSVVPSGKFLKIVQARNAMKDSIDIYSGAYTPNIDQMITRLIQLRHIPASEFNKLATNLKSGNGTIDVYEPTNTLIVSDLGTNVNRIMKIVAQLDVPGFEEQLTVIHIHHAKAKDIADLIDQIINKGDKNKRNQFGGGISRFRSTTDTGGTGGQSAYSLVLPDDRTNTIIVVGNQAGTEKIRNLVKTLDFPIRPEDAGGVNVYYVKYAEAEKIAETLNGLSKSMQEANKGGFKGTQPPPSDFGIPPITTGPTTQGSAGLGQAMFGGDVKITANKDTNSLIIIASKQDYQSVLSLLRKIDIPKDQVFVEAMIMELNASSNQAFGVNYYNFLPGTNGVGRQGFTDGSLKTLLDPTGGSGAILGFAAGDSVSITPPGGTAVQVKSLTGFINFLKSNSLVNVLSTPQIIALDNEKAEIEVGDNIPIGTEVTQGTAGSTTGIKREEATIKLSITPFISPKNSTVRMKIDQKVKQLSDKPIQAKNLADNAVVTTTRSVQTNIVVRDGDTAVLGGLMRDQESNTVTKVPVLGDIPILGWLFKSTQTKIDKVNLLVFITPKIIRNTADTNLLLGQKIDQRVDFVKDSMLGRDKFGNEIEKIDPRVATSKKPKIKPTSESEELQAPQDQQDQQDGQELLDDLEDTQ